MTAKDTNEMSFLEHLEVLRWHIIRALMSILVVAIIAFIFKNIVFDKILLAPKEPVFITNRLLCEFGQLVNIQKLCINSRPLDVISIKMAGQFSMHIMVSLVAGFVVAFPYVFHEFWRFIVPALYSKEKRHARGAVFYSSLLFLMGVTFGYFVITPLSIHFLGSYQVSDQVTNQINLISYVSTLASVVLAAGVIFELPILVYFLTKAGLVTPRFLRKYRRHSLVLILALSAIITPPDIFSQVLVALPLVILYEAGIRISRRIVTKREQEELEREREYAEADEQDAESSATTDETSGQSSDKSGKDADESGQSPGKSGKDADESATTDETSGQSSGKSGKDTDESGQSSGKSGKDAESSATTDETSGQSSGKSGKDADESGQSPGKSGKDAESSATTDETSGQSSGKSGKDADESGQSPGKSGKDADESARDPKDSGASAADPSDNEADKSSDETTSTKRKGSGPSRDDDDDDDDLREYDEYGDQLD